MYVDIGIEKTKLVKKKIELKARLIADKEKSRESQ